MEKPRFLNRKDEIILNRLRIGHTFATHNHLNTSWLKKTFPYAKHVEWSLLSNII